MNYTKLLLLIFFMSLFACDPIFVSQEKYDSDLLRETNRATELESDLVECESSNALEISQLQVRISEFQNTPSERLRAALAILEQGNVEVAETQFRELVSLYPAATEAGIATIKIDEITSARQAVIDAEIAAEAERARLISQGYAALEVNDNITIRDVSIEIQSVEFSDRWVSDNYGYGYYFVEPTRGMKMVVARYTISSATTDPVLPPLAAYQLTEGQLRPIGIMNMRFRRWSDYGAYLGNHADYENDFAHSEEIGFTASISFYENIADSPIFIVALNTPCLHRTYERFSNPPVNYVQRNCELPIVSNPSEVESLFKVVHILNRSSIQ